MPRRKRLNLTDIPLHIVQRGNNRAACFYAEQDYQFYLHWLEHYAKQYGCAIHAYALMTNHVHLLLSPLKPDAPAKLMQSLGRRYVQYVNKFYRRSGTLWEGRYKASLVQADEYLFACCRYIEINPVRASMVAHPRDYVWSSYRVNAEGRPSTSLTAHPLFSALGLDLAARQEAYQALFHTELDPDVITAIRGASQKGQVLGDERFKEEVARMTGQRVKPASPGRKRSNTASAITGEQVGFGF
jgi:putative transposase